MYNRNKALELLAQQRLLPLYYHDSAIVSCGILQALYDAGIRMVEYTARGDKALENFCKLREKVEMSMPGMLLGIGTIKSVRQAEEFMQAGADFIVCPTMNVSVSELAIQKDLLWIPGCMTPTEISTAEDAGAIVIKIFPGSILGPSYIHAIRELFPRLQFMPTGGVEANKKNLAEWFESGVIGVGMGSKLITAELVKEENYEALKEAAVKALYLVQQAAKKAERFN